MISRHFLTIALAAALASEPALAAPKTPPAPKAPSADAAFLAAFEAYRAGDPVKLARHAAALEGHVLELYAEFWKLKLRIEEAQPHEVRSFLAKYPGSYLANRLRADWLKELGERAQWEVFDLELALLVGEDLEIRCYAYLSRLARQDIGALDEAKDIWLEPKELPQGCVKLCDEMVARGRVTVSDVWQRVRLLLESGQISAARRALNYMPAAEAPDEKLLNQAATEPQRLLARAAEKLERRSLREMLLFAVVRLARSDPRAAAESLNGQLGKKLPAADRQYLWGRLGFEAARRHYPEALEWYAAARDSELSDEQLAWKARAALRSGDWQTVRDAIDPMSLLARQDAAWSYWYARALAALGHEDGARAYYLRISGQPNFYGVLAGEELGQALAVPAPGHVPGEEDIAQAKRNPGLARALELYRLNLRSEATREWVYTIRSLDDSQLLAAADLARRAEVFDRAINTADRTSGLHNYSVRYLAPFRDVFREYARAFDLEEAWVLGLTRQESRFIVDARSSAGARGLMQLMPATARWVAAKIGLKGFHPGLVSEPATNVTLGTRYLRFVLDDLGHPVLASAAYNAGPGRARRWRDAKPLEGAIYAETIPFNETRDYVKKVMANTMYYAAVLEARQLPLKQRLGVIPARAAGDRFNEELP